MAELDVFEARFAAACRRYLDEAPTEVNAAEVARTVVAQPRTRRLSWPATLPAAPALAWLVLLALVLTGLGAALFAGSQLQRRLPAVVPPVGQVYECPTGSTPDEPGPIDQARPAIGDAIAFDRHAGRLVAVGVSDWISRTVETWTFDVCTNTWTRMHPNREPPLFVTERLVYDVDSDVTILIAFLRVWAYDLEANTWTEMPGTPAGDALVGYDPLSGHLVATSPAGGDSSTFKDLWDYDVETDTWTLIYQEDGPRSGEFAYDASVDRMVVYTFGGDDGLELETRLLDLRTGTWSRSAAVTPDAPMGVWSLPHMAYDEAAKRTVVIARYRLAAYDATADRWEILVVAGAGEEWWPLKMVYDPVNRRLLGLGEGGSVVAFDLETREPTVLLEPGEGQPAP